MSLEEFNEKTKAKADEILEEIKVKKLKEKEEKEEKLN